MKKYQGITGKNSAVISLLFFVIGVIGAIGFRIILILNRINPIYASISWYIAVISYLFFYGYRLYIDNKRREIVLRNNLRGKVARNILDEVDRKNILRLLDSLLVSKSRWNYLILFLMSVLVLIIQLILDMWI